MADWRHAVARGDEMRGYRDWVAHMRGIEKTPYGWDRGALRRDSPRRRTHT